MGSWRQHGDSDWDTGGGGGRRAPGSPLPLLRVRAGVDGRLTPALRGFGPLDHNEHWWQAVLRDPRARPVDPKRLRDRAESLAGRTLTIACEDCKLRRSFSGDDVIARFGADYLVAYAKHDMADCPKAHSHRRCQIRYT
jgi:hypothetical protein